MISVLAIDPGASGGFAWRESDVTIKTCAMPDTQGDVLDTLRGIVATHPGIRAYVEQVGGFCGQGQPGSAMFAFGMGYGYILGALAAMGVSVVLVTPQRWQKALGCGTRGKDRSKAEWKRHLKNMAQRMYPTADVTLKTCDALLILAYARQQEGGK